MTEKYLKDRIELLKAMHTIVTSMNHEGAYYNSWIYLVPDCPSEDDFADIAEDDDDMEECAKLFMTLMSNYGKFGLCVSGDWDQDEFKTFGQTSDEYDDEE